MNLPHLFTEHPASIGESYFQHLRAGGAFGLRMLFGSLACLVHALLPFLFQHTGSNCVAELYQRMVGRRRQPPSSVKPAHPTASAAVTRSAAH